MDFSVLGHDGQHGSNVNSASSSFYEPFYMPKRPTSIHMSERQKRYNKLKEDPVRYKDYLMKQKKRDRMRKERLKQYLKNRVNSINE